MQRNQPTSPLMFEFLAWLSSRTRTYAETMEAWQTRCPRHCIWEDALAAGLIQIQSGARTVALTARGRAELGEDLDRPARPNDWTASSSAVVERLNSLATTLGRTTCSLFVVLWGSTVPSRPVIVVRQAPSTHLNLELERIVQPHKAHA
jgi:hypothetical protein